MKRVNQFKTQPSIPIVEPKRQQLEPITVVTSPPIPGKRSLWSAIRTHEKIAVIFLMSGILIGLIYAWMIDPVQWTGFTYQNLTPEDKGVLIQLASDLNAYDQNSPAVQRLRQKWPELDQLACFVVNNQPIAEDEKIRLVSLAYKINQKGCE